MSNDRFQEIDDLCIEALCESGVLLWNYVEKSNELAFFGNRGIEVFWGSSVSRFVINWNDFIELSVHAEDRDKVQQELSRVLHTSGDFMTVFRMKHFEKDDWDWINCFGKSATNADGKKYIWGTMRILPAQKLSPVAAKPFASASPKLANSDGRFSTIFNTLPFPCVLFDTNSNYIDYNAAALQFYGIDNTKNWQLADLSPEFQSNGKRSVECFDEYITEAVNKGQVVFEWMHKSSNGEPILAEMTLVRGENSDRHLVIGYVRDLRKLKQTQGERDRERQFLSNILNSSPICFVVVNGDSDDIKFVTPFTTHFLGAVVGDKFYNYFVDLKVAKQIQEEFRQNEFISWRPVTVKTKTGEIKEMFVNVLCVDYYETKSAMAWLIDVTEIRKIEAELRLARDAAEASSRTKSEFLANMSHEIRTPMNAILGMANLTLRTELTQKQREYIEAAEQSARLLLRIINDILDFSKIEAGRMVMEYHEFSLNEVIDDLDALVAESANKKKLELSFELVEGLPRYLMGDSIRLRQVLVNLVSNAIKFTNEGMVRVRVDMLEQDGLSAVLRFSVCDSGIGMMPDQMKSLFKPFTQADSSTTRKYGGTGLGLAICKSIVLMMKGNIHCESQLGQGTTFVFTARFGLPLEGDIILEDFSEIRTDALLLGDQHDSLTSIRNFLELLKSKIVAQIETSTDFEQFLKADRMDEIDFIIFNFDDLEHNGIQKYKMLRDSNTKAMPQVAFSTHPDLERLLKEQNMTLNNVHVLQKPIIASELFNILMSVMAEKKKTMIEEKKKTRTIGATRRTSSKFELPEYVRGMKILLAEDNRINQMVATEMLKMEGFNVDVAANGRLAVEMLEKNQYDLILMDIQMPEMDGLEATKIIRSNPNYKNLPILAMTAHAMMGDRELSLEAGMNDHITKPIDQALLFNAIVKWIRR